MKLNQIQEYEDIDRNEFCFTDGCGYINPVLALKLARKYNMSNASAFQIRIGGAKGICMVKLTLFDGKMDEAISDKDLE